MDGDVSDQSSEGYESEDYYENTESTAPRGPPSKWQLPSMMPKKVLFRFFEIYCHQVKDIPHEDHPQDLRRPTIVSHVCQYWRAVAIPHSILWKKIDFVALQYGFRCLSRITPETPLDIHLGCERHWWNDYSQEVYDTVRRYLTQTVALSIPIPYADEAPKDYLQWLLDIPVSLASIKRLKIGGAYFEFGVEEEQKEPG
jgi:hypothetical protein